MEDVDESNKICSCDQQEHGNVIIELFGFGYNEVTKIHIDFFGETAQRRTPNENTVLRDQSPLVLIVFCKLLIHRNWCLGLCIF